jgi:hypothetical protein
MGVQPGWLPAEESAAFFDMSVSSFVTWSESNPAAPQPYRLGRCKRWKLSELETYAQRGSKPSSDHVMDLINAAKSTQVR